MPSMPRRVSKGTDPQKYLKVRIKMLYSEKDKTTDASTLLILDKSIYELAIVLDLLKRIELQNKVI